MTGERRTRGKPLPVPPSATRQVPMSLVEWTGIRVNCPDQGPQGEDDPLRAKSGMMSPDADAFPNGIRIIGMSAG
jgi:hypothetical protein